MFFPRFRKDDQSRIATRAVRRLDRRIALAYRQELARMPRSPQEYNQLAARAARLGALADASRLLGPIARATAVDPELARQTLMCLSKALVGHIAEGMSNDPQAYARLSGLLEHALDAHAAIDAAPGAQTNAATSCVVLPSDLVYQAYSMLLPAERMLVVAGRRCGGVVTLGAVFDVTGTASVNAVRADPARLANALIAMDRAGAHLAAWMHSHPGDGPAATWPSPTDCQQHQDWIRDYSASLLSAIVVADGWIRLWGTSLELGQLTVEIAGQGISKEEEHGWLFRLARLEAA
jgi:hypothetical protein